MFLLGSLGDGRGQAAKQCLFRLFFFHFLPKQERDVRAHSALLLFCAALKEILHAWLKPDVDLRVLSTHGSCYQFGTIREYQTGMIAVNTKLVHSKKMSKAESQLHVRTPNDLKARLEQAAKSSGRSMNAEIVQRLEQSFSNEIFVKADDDMAEVNFTLAMELFEWKKEILDEVENDPNATEAEKAIAAHEFAKAERHMRFLFASAKLSQPLKAELAKRKTK